LLPDNNIFNVNFINLNLYFIEKTFKYIIKIQMGMGIGDWGLGIGDWGLGPIPNPQSPNPQSPIPNPHLFI